MQENIKTLTASSFTELQTIDVEKKPVPEIKKPIIATDNIVRDRKLGDFFIGRRKTAIAQIRLVKGSGKIIINKRSFETYFPTKEMQQAVLQPFVITKTESVYDMQVNVKGSGLSAQSEAVRTALSRCLDKVHPEFHTEIKKNGFLTMDSRRVERKKTGYKKARKKSQFSKR